MGLRRYSNICVLILLMCAIAVIEVQSAPKGSGENNSGSKQHHSHEKSKESGEHTSNEKHKNTNESDASIGDDNNNNIDDGDDKNDASLKPGNDENENDTSNSIDDDDSLKSGTDEDKSDSSVNDDDNKSDISIDISFSNGKNDTITGKDIKHDIILITNCIMRTRAIGTLIMHVTQLTKLVFVFVPILRTPIINYFNSLWVFLITVLIQFNYFLQVITNWVPLVI
ncbi:probable ATP-dependent helicase PF08_0048 [Cataglyphis hispanica]|uniref:probable ATP-dependent helicase PF08_0048 n=1 Tax=Cataglyphis hispanica TaxID=1086592 RepID=UPI00218008D9|nr:probable ATP-dependent helicase PF08_0048 [Cataglyphis hispanica]